jgi:hypothetical protein
MIKIFGYRYPMKDTNESPMIPHGPKRWDSPSNAQMNQNKFAKSLDIKSVIRFFMSSMNHTMIFNYYDNSHLCGQCNGNGCNVCFRNPLWQLSGQGKERFPLSRSINGCTPPYIQNSYAWKLSKHSAEHIILNNMTRTPQPRFEYILKITDAGS